MDVFVYGTLRDDVLRARLLGREVAGDAASLDGYAVLAQTTAHLPALCARPGDSANGLLLRNVTEEEVARFDTYEIPFNYLPHTLNVRTDAGEIAARVYLPEPQVDVSDESWSLDTWNDELGTLTREMALEIGAADPMMSGELLRRNWHMIAVRAAARLRAKASETPATVRYQPNPGDVTYNVHQPAAGEFFRFHSLDVTHRTFQGDVTPPLEREVALTCDAAIVLPYDPTTDCVLLVEQLRIGPLMRGDPNPWVLEPVAGIVDGDETPESAALRESEEEAGLTDMTLELMFRCYSTPGAATDFHNCYLALGRLPEPTSYVGGLVAENEDLRIHVIPFSQAFALIETGEANVGPLISMLLWLSHHRARIRGAA